MSKIFIDTNIWVYSLDSKDQEKRNHARQILRKIVDAHQPVLSTQVIQEFYVVATAKLGADLLGVKNIIHNFHNMEIVNIDLELVEEASDISILSKLSFWDSLIIAAAEKAKCEYIFSEDLNSGQTYRGVKVLNPFLMKSE
ncbi:MAG: PIN domain-containing protein [Spirochaetaceae bacterium]|nr:PIN domain-containing protein [Spirochaetaceae bacterium]